MGGKRSSTCYRTETQCEQVRAYHVDADVQLRTSPHRHSIAPRRPSPCDAAKEAACTAYRRGDRVEVTCVKTSAECEELRRIYSMSSACAMVP